MKVNDFVSGTKSQKTVVVDAAVRLMDDQAEGAPSPRTFASPRTALRLGSHPGL